MKSALSNRDLVSPIYHSQSDVSITSLSQTYNGSTVVFHDEEIGHLQTAEIADIDAYYAEQYKFFDQSEEEDILYEVVDGKKIYRQQHQVNTLRKKISFDKPMSVLDYGCAKGTVMKRLSAEVATVAPHLFDVSDMYSHLWDKFVPSKQYASYEPREEWAESFDLVTSFFAFEHLSDPLLELRTIKGLLKDDGLIYLVVPSVFANTGDFIVVDHVHHYSEASLTYLFSQAGFEVLEIDAESHFAAFIVVGKKTASERLPYEFAANKLDEINQKINEIAVFWSGFRDRVREFEQASAGKNSAIYGAGVYGNFIFSCLESGENCVGFLDQNPLLIGGHAMNKPIMHPDDLPLDVAAIYVGLNPRISRDVILGIDSWKGRSLEKLFV